MHSLVTGHGLTRVDSKLKPYAYKFTRLFLHHHAAQRDLKLHKVTPVTAQATHTAQATGTAQRRQV